MLMSVVWEHTCAMPTLCVTTVLADLNVIVFQDTKEMDSCVRVRKMNDSNTDSVSCRILVRNHKYRNPIPLGRGK